MKYAAAPLKYLTALFLFYLPFLSRANDGAFRASGNQLIPMYETDISVKKEILTIHRINAEQARIEVYYEFYNPKEPKALEVGFEAYSPSGDATKTPDDNGEHPYISKFTVTLNDVAVPFKVAIVHDSLYYRNGQYKAMPLAKAIKESKGEDYVDFFYVYHFRAMFKQGLNTIRHTYIVDLSSSVEQTYSLRYVLTAAKRWANGQIDDFTLQIDMGELQDICIPSTFFKNCSEWKSDSATKSLQIKVKGWEDEKIDMSEFFIRKGMLVFTKKDFKPRGELEIQSFKPSFYRRQEPQDTNSTGEIIYPKKFDSKKQGLPFSIELQEGILPPADDLSRKILHNLPFARRGYVFKSPELASYFEKQKWYMPDPAYTPELSGLTKKEQDWLTKTK
jgi:hypothetical protein